MAWLSHAINWTVRFMVFGDIPAPRRSCRLGGGSMRSAMGQEDVVKAAFQYRDALIHHAFVLLRDAALAEDVVQDAFIVVMRKWADFQPGTSVFHWVREIVRNKSLEALRTRRRGASALDEALLARVAAVMRSEERR